MALRQEIGACYPEVGCWFESCDSMLSKKKVVFVRCWMGIKILKIDIVEICLIFCGEAI